MQANWIMLDLPWSVTYDFIQADTVRRSQTYPKSKPPRRTGRFNMILRIEPTGPRMAKAENRKVRKTANINRARIILIIARATDAFSLP